MIAGPGVFGAAPGAPPRPRVCLTADHGNAEINVEPSTGKRHTAHTLSKVPAVITQKGLVLREGTLADVAPTILALFGLPIPKEMTGKILFDKMS